MVYINHQKKESLYFEKKIFEKFLWKKDKPMVYINQ